MVSDGTLKTRLRDALDASGLAGEKPQDSSGERSGVPTPFANPYFPYGSIASQNSAAAFQQELLKPSPRPEDVAEKPVEKKDSAVVEALDESVLKAIVEKTMQAQLTQKSPVKAVNNQSFKKKRRLCDLSDKELINWRPEQQLYELDTELEASKVLLQKRGEIPIASQNKTGATQAVVHQREESNQEVIEIGTYQFSPFSFQEPSEKIQSTTIEPFMRPVETRSQKFKSAFGASNMALEEPLQYHASERQRRVMTIETKGGTMVDLSGYKDLTKPPVSMPEGGQAATLTKEEFKDEMEYTTMSSPTTSFKSSGFTVHPHPEMESESELGADFSGNVRTLVRLVNDLPEGVTKQTGAQIIRLTMEAMGISMETVLSEAQSAQSELLDAVRSNIKKIEEYKTVIRKLESEIRYHQGKANELSEIIDLFILSNASTNAPNIDRTESSSY